MSVTSSGRSSTSTTIRWHSGLLRVIAFAMSCMIVVLPALGGETISARWPLPIGMIRSITRVVSFSGVVSRRSRWFRIQRGQLAELGALAGVLHRAAVDAVQANQRVELLPRILAAAVALLGHPHRTGDGVTARRPFLRTMFIET